MVGVRQMYNIVYSDHFIENLEDLINYWEVELNFTPEKIKMFIQSIDRSLKAVRAFPEMHEEISEIYDLLVPTYRILIGKEYAIFYRLNHDEKKILVGGIFSQKQMRIHF